MIIYIDKNSNISKNDKFRRTLDMNHTEVSY